MRILHTSDWHLGATLGELSFDQDHGLFLDWLLRTIEAEQVDVLLVSGDIFHNAQPSAEAQRRYFRFLAALRDTRLLRTIIVGGNHDSQARLDAPREVLDALSVTVVGGIEAHDDTRLSVVVNDRNGKAALGVAAIPFVHEYRLGVRLHVAASEIAADMRTRFTALYSRIADQLAAAAPGVPLIAMGHLSCGDIDKAWGGEEIHSVGGSYVLGPDIFDPRYCYVALGHIHGCYPVDAERRVWYCGSPVGVRPKEFQTPRNVMVLDVGDEGVSGIRKIQVPQFRDVIEITGDLQGVLQQLAALDDDRPLPTALLITVTTQEPLPGADDRITAELARFAPERRPIRCNSTRFVRTLTDAGAYAAEAPPVRLGAMQPEQVFVLAFQAAYNGDLPSDADLFRFRTLLTEEA